MGGLVHVLFDQKYFAENRFRFLVEWNPASLTQTNYWGFLPLHMVTDKNLHSFRILFDYGIRYYPMMKGIRILFQKDSCGDTLIQDACEKFQQKDVLDFVEETLARYSSTTPINSIDALMLAAIDERIHLDCVYFLLRRAPEALIQMVVSASTSTINTNTTNGVAGRDTDVGVERGGGKEEGGIDDVDNDDAGTKNCDDGDGDESEDGSGKNRRTSKDAT